MGGEKQAAVLRVSVVFLLLAGASPPPPSLTHHFYLLGPGKKEMYMSAYKCLPEEVAALNSL